MHGHVPPRIDRDDREGRWMGRWEGRWEGGGRGVGRVGMHMRLLHSHECVLFGKWTGSVVVRLFHEFESMNPEKKGVNSTSNGSYLAHSTLFEAGVSGGGVNREPMRL